MLKLIAIVSDKCMIIDHFRGCRSSPSSVLARLVGRRVRWCTGDAPPDAPADKVAAVDQAVVDAMRTTTAADCGVICVQEGPMSIGIVWPTLLFFIDVYFCRKMEQINLNCCDQLFGVKISHFDLDQQSESSLNISISKFFFSTL